MQGIKTIEQLESFMTKHGENTIDRLGIEIDRIEAELKVILVTCSRSLITAFLSLLLPASGFCCTVRHL